MGKLIFCTACVATVITVAAMVMPHTSSTPVCDSDGGGNGTSFNPGGGDDGGNGGTGSSGTSSGTSGSGSGAPTGHGGDDGGSGSGSCPTVSYQIFVRGSFNGSGSASVSGGSVRFSIPVTDSNGNSGTLSASLPVNNRRFAGAGSVMGFSVSINGRIDPADSSNRAVLHSTRLVATFSTADGTQYGRIAGAPSGAATVTHDAKPDDGP